MGVGNGEGVVDCEMLSDTGRELEELLDWTVDRDEEDNEPVDIDKAVDDWVMSFEADEEVEVVRGIVNDRESAGV